MRLIEVLESLILARRISKSTIANYRRSITYFCDFVGYDAKIEDLTIQRVNAWLASSEADWELSYVKSLRRDLLVVWNFAADMELCSHPKSRMIRAQKYEHKPATAWPANWIPRLLDAAMELPGKIKRHDVERCWYAEAYLRMQLELLCRPTDMRLLRWAQLSPDGIVEWTQHKTGHFMRCQVSRNTMRAVNRLKGMDREHVFPLSKTATECLIHLIFEKAGIEKPSGESFGHLRHTGGTAIASDKGNDAARRALGHTPGSRVFEKHYLDASKLPTLQAGTWWEDGQKASG